MRSLCKAGLPEGNVYEYSALKILKFEKKFRAEQRKKELLMKYRLDQEKEKESSAAGSKTIVERWIFLIDFRIWKEP